MSFLESMKRCSDIIAEARRGPRAGMGKSLPVNKLRANAEAKALAEVEMIREEFAVLSI